MVAVTAVYKPCGPVARALKPKLYSEICPFGYFRKQPGNLLRNAVGSRSNAEPAYPRYGKRLIVYPFQPPDRRVGVAPRLEIGYIRGFSPFVQVEPLCRLKLVGKGQGRRAGKLSRQ